MSSPTDPPDHDPLDLLASAYLDGETTAAEAARVADDPHLQARVDRLRSVRDAVRAAATAPVDAERREAAIAAALAAADELGPARRPVSYLAEVAGRRRGASPRSRWLLGVAAAALAALALVPALRNLGDHDSSRQVASSPTADRSSKSAGGSTGGGTAADSLATEAAPSAALPPADDAAGASGAPSPVSLGSFADVPALADAVRSALVPGRTTTTVTSGTTLAPDPAVTDCLARAQLDAETAGGSVVLTGSATLDGHLVAVTVVDQADGARTLVVTEATPACALISSTTL